ncbi:MAG: pantetheine-phosphate adenylyltransferase [Oligoflexus sp.]
MTKTRSHLKALFPGSFDPFTLGHLDVVEQALEIFDQITIGIGKSSSKMALFTIDERVDVLKAIFVSEPRIEIATFQGLAVKFANEIGAKALVRGLRTESDFSYEMPMAMTNRKLDDSLQTVFFPTKTDFAYVSSSLVKEVFLNQGDVSPFVPQSVLDLLKKKFNR